MARITYSRDGLGYEVSPVRQSSRESIYIQSDWDYPGLAQTFGMRLRHKRGCADRRGTDGTVECRGCGRTASEFIAQAADYLDSHDGKAVNDPGYFD